MQKNKVNNKMTTLEIAKETGLSLSTVRNMIKNENIPCILHFEKGIAKRYFELELFINTRKKIKEEKTRKTIENRRNRLKKNNNIEEANTEQEQHKNTDINKKINIQSKKNIQNLEKTVKQGVYIDEKKDKNIEKIKLREKDRLDKSIKKRNFSIWDLYKFYIRNFFCFLYGKFVVKNNNNKFKKNENNN